MSLLYYALKTLTPKVKAFERFTADPVTNQEKLLLEILQRNRETDYGLKYDFSSIKTASEFRARVPLADYETFRPYVEKMTLGEQNILTHDKPVFFSITSGTSSSPKLIPMTKYSESKKSEVVSLWSYYIGKDHPEIFKGKVLAIVSPEVVGYTKSGIAYGAESGRAYKNFPIAVKKLYSLPYEVFEINDYDARYYAILRISMEQNITSIATMTPSTIILLCQKIDPLRSDIINDIKAGTLKKDLDIPPRIREALEKSLHPNPKRAAELENILKEKNTLLPKDFWPNLELIECWKRGTIKVYLNALPEYFGDIPVRDLGYSSSEMRSSIPMSDKSAGGVLAINSNFYEFIPREDIDLKEKRILLCDQLEIGKEYFIVITTPGGLYRYNIDDIIRVVDFFNKTPVIEFVQKGGNVTSATGEKLYESHVVDAVEKAADECDLAIEFFVAILETEPSVRYAFLVEFVNNPGREKKKRFLAFTEKVLCLTNEEYEFNRTAQELGPPVLKVLRHGSFAAFREKKIKEGTHDAHFKVSQLIADPDFQKNFDVIEEIQ